MCTKNENPSCDAKEPLTGEQCLALLPPEAPRSKSIFSAGFYFNGRGIKFRRGFWAALTPTTPPEVTLLLLIFPKSFLLLFAIFSDTLKWKIVWLTFALADYAVLFFLVIWPSIEFDINSKTVRNGRFFISKIPFIKIESIHISKTRKYQHNGIGTRISLCLERIFFSIKEIVFLPVWEEVRYTEMIKISILHLLGNENLKVEYFLDNEPINIKSTKSK